jgi:hypothetical protein
VVVVGSRGNYKNNKTAVVATSSKL